MPNEGVVENAKADLQRVLQTLKKAKVSDKEIDKLIADARK
jgi:hypothetical protein